jgi:fumarate reductase subunit D
VKISHEAVAALFESALGIVVLLVVAALAYFVGGHLIGQGQRHSRRHQPAPAAGSVPDHRHQNVTNVSVR